MVGFTGPGLRQDDVDQRRGDSAHAIKHDSRAMKRIPALLAIIFLLFILAWALLRANAAWHFFAAKTISVPLFETGTGTVTAFEQTEFRINTALKRFPNNPDYLDFAGRLKMLQSTQIGVMGAERRALLESAAESFRQALSARPLWPYSWVSLLAAKDKLDEVDMEFNTAMRRAVETGPWEPRVQLQVIRSGLRHWGALNSNGQKVVTGSMKNALKVQPRQVFEIARWYARPDLLCGLQTDQAQIQRWCDSVE